MKSSRKIRSSSTAITSSHRTNQTFPRKLSATCLALVLAIAPIVGARADDGYMVMQVQFDLNKKAQFRQINMAYQEGVGTSLWSYYGETLKSGVVVPLYSLDIRNPGLFNQLLFNRLDEPESEDENEKPKTSIRAVLSGILGAGIIAAYAYATGKCVDDISNGVTDSSACEAL